MVFFSWVRKYFSIWLPFIPAFHLQTNFIVMHQAAAVLMCGLAQQIILLCLQCTRLHYKVSDKAISFLSLSQLLAVPMQLNGVADSVDILIDRKRDSLFEQQEYQFKISSSQSNCKLLLLTLIVSVSPSQLIFSRSTSLNPLCGVALCMPMMAKGKSRKEWERGENSCGIRIRMIPSQTRLVASAVCTHHSRQLHFFLLLKAIFQCSHLHSSALVVC